MSPLSQQHGKQATRLFQTFGSQFVLAPPDYGLETMATPARPVLGRKLASRRGVLNCGKLTALRASSATWNPVWWRVVSLHV